MAIDGLVIKLKLPVLRKMISLLRRFSNNLNQIKKHINVTGRIYAEAMEEILHWQEKLWQCANEILKKLVTITRQCVLEKAPKQRRGRRQQSAKQRFGGGNHHQAKTRISAGAEILVFRICSTDALFTQQHFPVLCSSVLKTKPD